MKRTALLFTVMGMALVLSSTIALAATFTSTAADETLTGTKKSDTFVFDDDWGEDTVVDPKGKDDTLDFSAVAENMNILLCPDLTDEGENLGLVDDFNGNTVEFTSEIENAVGGSDFDFIIGCGLKNTLDGGSGAESDILQDFGGVSNFEEATPSELPATSDTYTGFSTTSGVDLIFDVDGKKDKADFGSIETDQVSFFQFDATSEIPGDESLAVLDDPENPTFGVQILNYFGEGTNLGGEATIGPGEIEKLQFDDRKLKRKKVEELVQPLPEATVDAAGLSSSKASSAKELPGLLGDIR